MCASKKPPDSDPPFSVDDDAGTHPAAGTVRASFDADLDVVVTAIVETVATVTGRNVGDMRPLFEIVDGEALTDLVTSSRKHPIEVMFSYEDCRVSVSNRIDSPKLDLTVRGEFDE